MTEILNTIVNHEERTEEIDTSKHKESKLLPDHRTRKRRTEKKTSGRIESGGKLNVQNLRDESFSSGDETYRIFQALFFVLAAFVLSYDGLSYGSKEYSILKNGQIVNGYVSVRRAVISFSFGYSVLYSILSSIAALMLLHSLVSKNPRWSLPMIVIYMLDLVWHMADGFVAFWFLFSHLKLPIALIYASGIVLIITVESWLWLGIVRLYELRM